MLVRNETDTKERKRKRESREGEKVEKSLNEVNKRWRVTHRKRETNRGR